MNNWNTSFNYGDAGEIIITGRDRPLVEPHYDDVRRVLVVREQNEEGENEEEEEEEEFEDERVYENNIEGRKLFKEDERKYLKLKSEKQRLLSKLLSLIDGT
jgi:hypothetical protein